MSRVTYTDTPTTAAQDLLRQRHAVRLVVDGEEGTGVDALPAGVYGFTYSPALPNAPLFAARRYRTFETHKLSTGEVILVGFASPEAARALESADGDVTMEVYPEPDEGHDVLVAIAYGRIRRHRRFATPNQQGLMVTMRGGADGPSSRAS